MSKKNKNALKDAQKADNRIEFIPVRMEEKAEVAVVEEASNLPAVATVEDEAALCDTADSKEIISKEVKTTEDMLTGESKIKEEMAEDEKKIEELEAKLSDTNKELEELQSSENHLQNEDLMVQEKHWMEERARKERESEDLVRKELFEKQRLIEQMRKEQAEKFVQNKQMTLYNQLHEEEQKEQIYALHGITLDKVEGMNEYKNAVYQGAVFSMFMMALALCAYIGYIEGVDTKIFFAMLSLAGAESTVLLHERDGKLQSGLYGIICKLFGILTTPVMLFLYTVYELEFVDMSLTLWGCAVYAILMYIVGSADFFLRNPYRKTGRAAREARTELKDMKRTAARNVKKNQKLREKMEAKLLKRKENQERKLENAKQKERQKTERLNKKLQMQQQKQAEYEAVAAIRRENKAKRMELRNQKIVAIKSRIADWTNKKDA